MPCCEPATVSMRDRESETARVGAWEGDGSLGIGRETGYWEWGGGYSKVKNRARVT